MKVDIWSDVLCPFCYIGKRKFEAALEQFPNKENVEVVWHSFQLDPSLKTQPGKNVYDHLAERKGQTRAWSVRMHEHVTNEAKKVGLNYNFDKAVIANSFDAHRLIQLAKTHGLGDEAKETLFKAYFTEGKNISDHDTLVQLCAAIGLDETEVEQILQADAYAEEVHADEAKAHAIGVRGVPYFMINEQYAVSGAQSPEIFLQALEQGWKEFEKENAVAVASIEDGGACSADGNC